MSEDDKDMFMYVLEAMAYISASFAAIIYIWETCFKEFKKKRRRDPDIELGLSQLNNDNEDNLFYSSSSNNSSPELGPSTSLRNRNNSIN